MNSTYTCSLLVDMMLIGFRYERSLSFSMPSYLFVITFFTFVVPHLVRSFCPDRCVCDQNDVISVECINTNFSVIPSTMDPFIKILNLKNNRLKEVGSASFQFHPELVIVDLSSNQLRSIQEKNIRGSKQTCYTQSEKE